MKKTKLSIYLSKILCPFFIILLTNLILIPYEPSNLNSNIYSGEIRISADTDGDGMPDDWEDAYNLDSGDPSDKFEDLDLDGLDNYYEYTNKTNPQVKDTDSDGLWDGWEVPIGLNATLSDTDADGLSDGDEILIYNTDANCSDSDNDGMSDGWEVSYGLNPLDYSDRNSDPDSDNIISLWEYHYGTNPNSVDSDSDGLNDTVEINLYGTNPISSDTDGDGLGDNWEIIYKLDPISKDESLQDPDKDGIINIYEYLNGTSPLNNDTDGDGFLDPFEILVLNTSATDPNDPNYFPLGYTIIIEASLGVLVIFLIYLGISTSRKDISYFQAFSNILQKLKSKLLRKNQNGIKKEKNSDNAEYTLNSSSNQKEVQ